MFDKNAFKNAFRKWVETHPTASEQDAREFCQNQIPACVYMQYYWLVEQSLQWYCWLKQRNTSASEDLTEEEGERMVC